MTQKKPTLKRRFLNYGKYFIKEIIPVTFGILIALSIGNWSQTRKDKRYIREISSLIHKELEETLEDIEYNMPLQQTLLDTLEHYTADSTVSVLQIVQKAEGIYGPAIRMNAWHALSNAKIELVDYKKIAMLSSLDQARKIFDRKTESLTNFVLNEANNTDKDKKELFNVLLKDVMGSEGTIKTIIEDYKEW